MADEKTERKRGAGFPVVPLDEAAEQVRRVGTYGTQHHINAFAEYLGHSTPNSGPFKRRLAAFRDWGLIARDGSRIVLTELGKRIALPDDPSKEAEYLREAFRSCDIFVALYDRSAKGVELESESLANSAVHNLNISVASKKRFSKSFMRSTIAAGIATAVGDSKIRLLPIGEHDASSFGEKDQEKLSDPRADMGTVPAVLHQEWSISGGDISFLVRSRQALPAECYELIRDVVQAIDALREQLGSVEEPETEVGR